MNKYILKEDGRKLFVLEKLQRDDQYYMIIKKEYKYGYSAQYVRISEKRFKALKVPVHTGDLPEVDEGEIYFL
ncbi:hypothetical protein [Effusibacillus lacus]|uniref:hypothetical protein n=1 Tax=Effusibacillus lacus TaxID=1348429 RepID=UPI000BB9B730|nr:hypothetical protein [Effusibacillus lacus]TCS75638.1 hypothetical protein EDD64_10610 [Effusibacillus lacus]